MSENAFALSLPPSPQLDHAIRVVRTLHDAGQRAVWAGGSVRDMLMQRVPADYDIATDATPQRVEQLFANTVAVGARFGVILVVGEENLQCEVATFRQEGVYLDGRRPSHVTFSGPEEDARRRDFTVNGLFYDPINEQLLDYVGGRADIQAQLLRTIGDPHERFQEDKLRLLRTVRFAAALDFRIEPDTWKALQALAQDITVVSAERVRDELGRLFTGPHCGRGLDLLDESGLLEVVLPEVSALKGVAQPPQFHPEGDVFVHTRLMMEQLNDPDVIMAFSALLHDIGKPSTYEEAEDRIRFNRHASVGADMTKQVCQRLRFSNRDTDDIVACVANHMGFRDTEYMRPARLDRFLQRPTLLVELELHRADCLASHGDLSIYERLTEQYKAFQERPAPPERLLTGHDLQSMGYATGPSMGKILSAVDEARLDGAFSTSDEARAWVLEHIPLPT